MSLPAARVTKDNVLGGPILTGSYNVFINGRPAAFVGSVVGPHASHTGVIIKGDYTVYINGKPAARQGDLTSCGHNVTTGSYNVWV
jgi:uncharacterized Zn-binding protein involved in type VI secretion